MSLFGEVDKNTLTLTVNRMLTGSTVEQWDTMIYLKDTSSPESAFDYDIRKLNDNQDIEKYINEEIERQLLESFWTNYQVDRLNTPVTSSPFWKTFLAAQIFLGDGGF